jgi:DNA-binding MarR family transcriptional regulator
MEQIIRNYSIWYCSVWNSFTWNYIPSSGNTNMRPWDLLLHNVNVLHSVLERAEPELSSLELDAKRLFILCTVEAHPFPADLARALSLPKPSMTFLVKKLEESGYLRRQGEKGDLRRYRLTITPSGIKARDKGVDAANRIFGACLNSLSAADQATFSRIVDRLRPRASKTKQRNT